MHDDLDIPAFLKRDKDEPRQPCRKRLRWTRDMKFNDPPTREEEAATKALRKQIDRERRERIMKRLATVRELYGVKKR
jgi:hypothetical protein